MAASFYSTNAVPVAKALKASPPSMFSSSRDSVPVADHEDHDSWIVWDENELDIQKQHVDEGKAPQHERLLYSIGDVDFIVFWNDIWKTSEHVTRNNS